MRKNRILILLFFIIIFISGCGKKVEKGAFVNGKVILLDKTGTYEVAVKNKKYLFYVDSREKKVFLVKDKKKKLVNDFKYVNLHFIIKEEVLR